MYESILQRALELPREQKESLIAALKAAVFEETSRRGDGDPDRCPRCGHHHVVRKRHGRKGAQVWLCRGCGRTFTARTDRVLALSKLGAETWAQGYQGGGQGRARVQDLHLARRGQRGVGRPPLALRDGRGRRLGEAKGRPCL